MADATDDGGLRGSLSPETLAFYEDAFGTMDPINGQVAPQQFLDLIKVIGVDANIDTAAKVVNDCGGLDFDSFLELVQDCDSSSVTAFRRSFRSTVEQRIKDIEGREAAARAHEQRIDEAVSFVKAAKLSQATLDHLNRKYDELLEHGNPVGVEEIAKGLRDEGDLVEEQARRDAWILVEQASLDDDKSTVCREAFLRQCADRKEGWQYWWRGDRIQRDDRGFSAGGGLGLLNDIADAGWRIKNERLANKWREDDRKEEARLLARVHELQEERLGGSRSYLR